MAKTIGSWDFKEKHVDPTVVDNSFVSSESAVICVVPKTKSGSVTDWIPVGLVENFTLQQRKQLMELYEIGSKEQFQVPGKTTKRLSLTRVLFNGSSLMKAISGQNGVTPTFGGVDDPGGKETSSFYINLASSYFDNPIDIGLVFHDQSDNEYGAMAMVGCYIESHTMTLAAQQTVVMESVSMTCNKVVPAVYGAD